MTSLPPDEELPRRLDALEESLNTNEHKWFGRATLLAAVASGVALLLPWTFSRRSGLSVWQLGLESQPSLAFAWLAGLLTTITALVLRPGPKSHATAAITAVLALLYTAAAWQAKTLSTLTDSWPGPGPAVAIITGLTWLLTAAAHLLATTHTQPPPPSPEALTAATTRLRHRQPPQTPPAG
jgi:hypothetical protein